LRILLYTGKGGVGKTSVAGATALRCAEFGHKTLVMSVDMAHSLADSLDVKLDGGPKKVARNIWAQEVNALDELHKHWGKMQKYISTVLATRGVDDIVAEESSTLPGLEELTSLIKLKQHADSGEFEVIVVDCAPTGETMQLFAFPEVTRWWLDRIFPIQRRVLKVARPVVGPLVSLPLPDDQVFAAVKELFTELEGLTELLKDNSVSSMRLVLNLERMVIREAQRSFTYANLYGISTDCAVVNRAFPDQLKGGYFSGWVDVQARYMEEVKEAFAPLPVLSVRYFDREVVGKKMLEAMASELFGEGDPATRYYRGSPHRVKKDGEEYVLSIELPFTEKKEISLLKKDEELILSIGNRKRNMVLPRSLASKGVKGANYENGSLKITFGGREDGQV
jgi:arsenite-transporting ATPase